MPPKLIILNGPPGVGKDTIAHLLCEQYGLGWQIFKDELVRIGLAVAGISAEDWVVRYTREMKDQPWGRLGGLSQRQYLIRVSEEWIKPTFGVGYFGTALAKAVKHLPVDIVVPDGGFIEEVQAVRACDIPHEVHVIRLHRAGYTFEGDSRSYLYLTGAKEADLHLVDGDPQSAVEFIAAIAGFEKGEWHKAC